MIGVKFLVALQFLTGIPVKIHTQFDEKLVAQSMAFFSLIGLILGGCAVGVHFLLAHIFSLPVSNFFAVVFLIILTGNLHGDGLMDTADGVFSGRPRERILEIMKDSRVGSHGVMAAMIFFLGRLMLLGEMPQEMQEWTLVLATVFGRWSQVLGAAWYPYARKDGGTASFTNYVGYREVLISLFFPVVLSVYLLKFQAVLLLGFVVLSILVLNNYFLKKIGGVTGDTLGAVNECVEVLLLLMLVIFDKFS
ncbi:adenosylcobinamide-GDP ribazoletransferase [Dehalobacterium formicoaceticum]|uniref:Adenosylcobinamide-GDP ribazoletransferase n=1 Tax=Dehalobacterium formicoaceticum TaxID=51515 RepID=A0ABT1Y3V9_9FIRM|nr:adenosylcobinamide-GDP ribazoletransferase [Dehalobacterium formicoaceticum]MCR6545570.1 adenosylcobinamide-GDP ribazoletransferase [Dehalobacterium formicoaceticum]